MSIESIDRELLAESTGKLEPIRLCVGCGVRASRQELLRVVHADSQVIFDDQKSLPGRGAWLHRDTACVERAISRGVFPRVLRVSGKLDTRPLENRLENTMDN